MWEFKSLCFKCVAGAMTKCKKCTFNEDVLIRKATISRGSDTCTSCMHKTISEVTEVDMDKACDVLFMDNSCLHYEYLH